MDANPNESAFERALRSVLDGVYCPPMSVERLRRIFNGIGRGKMLEIIKATPGHRKWGNTCQLPLKTMPDNYVAEFISKCQPPGRPSC